MFIVILIMLGNCHNNPYSSDSEDDFAFAIYFLRDETLKMGDVYDKDLNKLKLA